MEQTVEELTTVEKILQEKILQIRRVSTEEQLQSCLEQCEQILDRGKSLYKKLSKQIDSLKQNGRDMGTEDEIKNHHRQELTNLRASLQQITQLAQKRIASTQTSSSAHVNSTTTSNHTSDTVKVQKNSNSKPAPIPVQEELAFIAKSDDLLTEEERNQKQLIEQELFEPVFRKTQQALDIVNRLNVKATETIEIATDTSEMLKKQKEQFSVIDQELDKLSGNTKIAKRELRFLFRKLVRDKAIICLAILVVLTFIIAILLLLLYRFAFRDLIQQAIQNKYPKQPQQQPQTQ